MADPKEDKIDFGKLERELFNAVEADASYWRENDAKLRAMEQRVESYDQFRDMVAAAHIKPLDKKDKIGQGQRNQPWNPFSSSNVSSSSASSTSPTSDGQRDSNKEAKVVPKNGHEFTKEWRKQKKSGDGSCYSYLIELTGEKLIKIFKSEISFGLLGEIVTVLNDDALERDYGKITDILECLTRAGRFSLSLDFLSKVERQKLAELVAKLEQWSALNAETVDNRVAVGEEDSIRKSIEKEEQSLGDELKTNGKSAQGQGTDRETTQDGRTVPHISIADVEKLRKLYKLDGK